MLSRKKFQVLRLRPVAQMSSLPGKIIACAVTLLFLLQCDECDAETVMVRSDGTYEKAVTITQATLGVTYTNYTDRF